LSTVLPKTRSGKLLRRAIQAVCEGRDPGDLTTMEDPAALQQITRSGDWPECESRGAARPGDGVTRASDRSVAQSRLAKSPALPSHSRIRQPVQPCRGRFLNQLMFPQGKRKVSEQ
jgi:hypothetical protein